MNPLLIKIGKVALNAVVVVAPMVLDRISSRELNRHIADEARKAAEEAVKNLTNKGV